MAMTLKTIEAKKKRRKISSWKAHEEQN
jgi:hypothetical protein